MTTRVPAGPPAVGTGDLPDRAGGAAAHWDGVHVGAEDERSWFQAEPMPSLDLVTSVTAGPNDAVIDVGAGTSRLADGLLAAGFRDVTLLDVSHTALARVRARLGADPRLTTVVADVRDWRPARPFAVWHDRATVHFLVEDRDLADYVAAAATALRAGGHAVLAAFAPDGPTTCSSLPVRRHDAATLASAFAPRFTLVRSLRDEHRTPSGTVQPFTWVVLRRVEDEAPPP